MELYLIRHAHYIPDGESSRYIQRDGHLSEDGKLQSERLGERFVKEGLKFDKIYSSKTIRAEETAQICCRVMGIEGIISSEELVEDQIDEEPNDVVNRMRDFIDDIKSKFDEGCFGIFSHCFAIRYLLRTLEKNADLTVLPHTGVALLNYSSSKPIIFPYDTLKHLNGIESY